MIFGICICALIICILHYANDLIKKNIISLTRRERDEKYLALYGKYVLCLDIRKDLVSDMYEFYVRNDKSFEDRIKDKLKLLSLISKMREYDPIGSRVMA